MEFLRIQHPKAGKALILFLALTGLAGSAVLSLPTSGKPLRVRAAHLYVRGIRALRTIAPKSIDHREVRLENGELLSGIEPNFWTRLESLSPHNPGKGSRNDLHLLDDHGRLHLLRSVSSDAIYREVTSQTDWSGYNGNSSGNRYSALTSIGPNNVAGMERLWEHTFDSNVVLTTTPALVGGILYATSWNEVYALDAGSGRELWHFRRPRTPGYVMNRTSPSRGVATTDDSVFLMTDNAHLVSLNRFTGSLQWEVMVADSHLNYFATSAPLAVKGMIVTGVGGGDGGARGLVAAFDQKTGQRIWQFWTVPDPGQPGSETWGGMPAEHGGAATWLTGSYDPEADIVYWPTGNPGSDYNGTIRPGDNLYSDSVVALRASDGKLLWHYQFTPHDVWDWDATEPLVLVDAEWEGKPRKLLLQANRNGFFYVLDRLSGKLLLAEPFVSRITWATGIGRDGRPLRVEGQEPTAEGNHVCPAVGGATNFYPSSYNPVSGLFYIVATEQCGTFTLEEVEEWQAGKDYTFGSGKPIREDHPMRFVRALDIHTGKAVWNIPTAGDSWSRNGVLTTASGLVFLGGIDGSLLALDARTGKQLWRGPLPSPASATPMTFEFDGRQQVAIANRNQILVYGLPLR